MSNQAATRHREVRCGHGTGFSSSIAVAKTRIGQDEFADGELKWAERIALTCQPVAKGALHRMGGHTWFLRATLRQSDTAGESGPVAAVTIAVPSKFTLLTS